MPPADFLVDLFGLAGQTAVVIGGTGTLGSALAKGLAQAGAFVVISGRDPAKGAVVVNDVAGRGGEAAFVPVDVKSRASIEGLLAQSLQLRRRVEMLVNCAGANSASPYLDADDDNWRHVMDCNLTSTHWGCQVFGRHMIEAGGGSILNIGSVTAHLPLSRVFAYSASKAAVVNLTQNVAREFAPSKVRVNAICPGFFPAEQNRAILDDERINNILAGTPMHRFGEPSELVGTALLLLSAKAGSYITGSTIYVDGGFTAARF